jgi:hypothetical protein
MTELPPLLRDQRKIDAQHLRLLTAFHFVLAGFACAGFVFLFVYWTLFSSFMFNPGTWDQKHGVPSPADVARVLKFSFVIFLPACLAWGLANLISGFSIRVRKRRTFSLVVAGLNCLWMPFGTLLGVFTLIVLLRDSVRELYDAYQSDGANAALGAPRSSS